jgi:hypothetical protein
MRWTESARSAFKASPPVPRSPRPTPNAGTSPAAASGGDASRQLTRHVVQPASSRRVACVAAEPCAGATASSSCDRPAAGASVTHSRTASRSLRCSMARAGAGDLSRSRSRMVRRSIRDCCSSRRSSSVAWQRTRALRRAAAPAPLCLAAADYSIRCARRRLLDRPLLTAARRRRPLRSHEREDLRVVRGTGRPSRPLRPLSLGSRGVPGRGPLRDRADAGLGASGDRGVVAEGAVGTRVAGRLRLFRYEIRCWRNGVIPDVAEAVESPQCLDDDPARARQLIDLVPRVPTPVRGRDELRAGEMWNSNSLVSWLLTRSGVDIETVTPPPGGRAPGWQAGIVIACRELDAASARSRLPPDADA